VSYDDLRTGVIIAYPFLWAHQTDRGETEGRKQRSTVVALRLPRRTGDAVVLRPITTKQPGRGRRATEVPDTEKQRAGLDLTVRCWIMLDEFNTDVIGKSYYLEPEPPLGTFSRIFFLPIARAFVTGMKEARNVVRR
jgi:hypothetical protein